MQDSKLFLSEGSATERPRWGLWRSRALIFGLISASTSALLLCPCDCPGQNPHATILIAISILIGGGAEAGEHGADRGAGAADHGGIGGGCAVGAHAAAAFRAGGPGHPPRDHPGRPA